MKYGTLKWVCAASLLLSIATAPAYAQSGASSSITGVVVDTSGGAIPGASVAAKNDATSGISTVVTSSNGRSRSRR